MFSCSAAQRALKSGVKIRIKPVNKTHAGCHISIRSTGALSNSAQIANSSWSTTSQTAPNAAAFPSPSACELLLMTQATQRQRSTLQASSARSTTPFKKITVSCQTFCFSKWTSYPKNEKALLFTQESFKDLRCHAAPGQQVLNDRLHRAKLLLGHPRIPSELRMNQALFKLSLTTSNGMV